MIEQGMARKTQARRRKVANASPSTTRLKYNGTMKGERSAHGRPIGVNLFAGTGGLSLGFQQAGFDVLAAVEYDPIHAAAHEYNFPHCATICRSVADIDGEYIRANSKIGRRDVDVVFGGAPCQGFSMIGKRALAARV